MPGKEEIRCRRQDIESELYQRGIITQQDTGGLDLSWGNYEAIEKLLFMTAKREGFGDTMSMMIFDDPIIGRNFRTDGGVVLTPDTANQQYPCTSTAVHTCGQILGGVLWEICGCGAMWADDKGGKPEWKDPVEWVSARAALSKAKGEA